MYFYQTLLFLENYKFHFQNIVHTINDNYSSQLTKLSVIGKCHEFQLAKV